MFRGYVSFREGKFGDFNYQGSSVFWRMGTAQDARLPNSWMNWKRNMEAVVCTPVLSHDSSYKPDTRILTDTDGYDYYWYYVNDCELINNSTSSWSRGIMVKLNDLQSGLWTPWIDAIGVRRFGCRSFVPEVAVVFCAWFLVSNSHRFPTHCIFIFLYTWSDSIRTLKGHQSA